MSGLQRANIPG